MTGASPGGGLRNALGSAFGAGPKTPQPPPRTLAAAAPPASPRAPRDLLADVLASIERQAALDSESSGAYPDLGADGNREFLASCDFEDLRLGEMANVLGEYKRAMAAVCLGTPSDVGGVEKESKGRFVHVTDANALRIGELPGMLTELQGALIALA